MDYSLPQPPNPDLQPKKNIIIKVIIIIAVVLVAGLIIYSPKLFKKTPQTPTSTSTEINSPEMKKAVSEIRNIKGKITLITPDNISVNTSSGIETLSLANLVEVGEALDPSDGSKTKKVDKTELKVGQNVQIITNESSNSARIILIIK